MALLIVLVALPNARELFVGVAVQSRVNNCCVEFPVPLAVTLRAPLMVKPGSRGLVASEALIYSSGDFLSMTLRTNQYFVRRSDLRTTMSFFLLSSNFQSIIRSSGAGLNGTEDMLRLNAVRNET